MSNNLTYGGIVYPNNPFMFDKIYENLKEAKNKASADSVLVGRYVLIAYCNTAFGKDERNEIEGNWSTIQATASDEQKAYRKNYEIDGHKSNDRKVLRKSFNGTAYTYEEITSLHSNLSDQSIAVLGIKAGDKILSTDTGRVLSSTLTIKYNSGTKQLELRGIDEQLISSFDASVFIKDGMLESVVADDTNNQLIFTWNTDGKKDVTTIDLNSLLEDVFGDINNNISTINTKLNNLEDRNVVATKPSFSIKWTNNGSFEAGTKKILSYNISFTDGKYKYPIPNGAAMNCDNNLTYSVNFNGQTENTSSESFNEITLTPETNITATAQAAHGDSTVTPVTSLGVAYPEGKYSGKTLTLNSTTLRGYRQGCFYGTVSTSSFTVNNITSDIIRGLGKLNAAYSATSKTMTIPIGTTAILIACPKNKTGPINVLNTTVNAPMTTLFGKGNIVKTLRVEGANNEAGEEYNVWMYKPTNPYGSENKLTITLG